MEAKDAIRSTWQRYFVGVAVIAAAAALRVWPLQALGERLAWLTFYPAVAAGALYGGFFAGLLGTVLSCLAVLFLLPALVGQPFIRDSADWLGMAVFFATCAMISGIAEATLRANARAKQAGAQAEAVNRELEAFSYSVAHDLRAPLRSIDGFSQALLEDSADKLDEEGRRYLRFVRESAQQMAQLIDGLLTLSRVTRSEIARERADLSALARASIARLQRSQPDRRVDVVIREGLEGEGDPQLLTVVLDNLVGNAWKFTGKRDEARIEFGASSNDRRPVYFVRDNGAGFDMTFADKLFGVFQRLHGAAEFEGTGVGLATVQRIVHRHGGRVWAEGEVNGGATFYFTLNEKERVA
jgi:light-regulated signal transduction histidine kinase (bacteriophytochrome)